MNYKLLLRNKTLIKLLLITLSCLILFIFRDVFAPVNLAVEKIFSKIKGETKPDSSIVLIHISESDLESIGPWPIKRSYYALLINKLSDYNVREIGLEVFFSAKFISQTVYDNLLTNEIEKFGDVTLSSVAGKIKAQNELYLSDSLSYPTPKLLNNSVHTGHINYLQNSTIKIPLLIKSGEITEPAFAYSLFGINNANEFPSAIEVNFISTWQKFENYSLLEFYDLIQSQSTRLKNLKNKIIIIGVSDPNVTQNLETNFDEQSPAFTLHAFALDNLINRRFYRSNYFTFSTIIFSFIFLLVIWYQQTNDKRKYSSLIVGLFSLLVFSFILYSYFFFRLDYLAIVLPFTTLLFHQVISELIEKKSELRGIKDETIILKTLLSKKEIELSSLKNELKLSDAQKSDVLEVKIKSLESEISKLQENNEDKTEAKLDLPLKTGNFHGIIYKSKAIQNIVELIQKTATENATILITGESGTGKELIARSIHALSDRHSSNFVAVNCGAISETLLESELFGHVKGSFTGAVADKIGKFEAADGGTLFLDEIGETSENFQVKLLRVLQSGEFDKVGSSKTSRVDIRIIAATNKNLEQSVKEKKFREDLFYRLNVIRIDLPPLRDRKEDIEALALHFMNNESPDFKISKAAITALLNHNWPGNIRELESVIKRAIIFARSGPRSMIQMNDLPSNIVKKLKLNFEDLVLDSLRQKKFSHSSIVETAKELGNVSRTLISENFRGLLFKTLIEFNFNEEKVIDFISSSDEAEVKERVQSKLQTFLNNVRGSLKETSNADFENVKEKLSSKYKNLPQKFHPYLDEVIKNLLN